MMGSLKGQVRVAFARDKVLPRKLTGLATEGGAGAVPSELQGKYFRVLDEVHDLGNGQAALKAVPQTSDEQWGWIVFNLDGGDGVFGWSDSDGDAKNAPAALQTK